MPYGKRLPGALYLLDPGADPRIPSLLRITVAELRRRLEIGPEFNLLKFHTGRYVDEGDVVREALRVLERQEFDESHALEAAILEGVHSPHQRYDASVMDRIRQNAGSIA